MDKSCDILEYIYLSISSVHSIANIEEVLSIILLVINVIWLLCKFGYKIYTAFADKVITEEEIDSTFGGIIDGLGQLQEEEKDNDKSFEQK